VLGLQLLLVYLPFMNAWFNSAPVGPSGWLLPLGLATDDARVKLRHLYPEVLGATGY
jgi:hypothetical protein